MFNPDLVKYLEHAVYAVPIIALWVGLGWFYNRFIHDWGKKK